MLHYTVCQWEKVGQFKNGGKKQTYTKIHCVKFSQCLYGYNLGSVKYITIILFLRKFLFGFLSFNVLYGYIAILLWPHSMTHTPIYSHGQKYRHPCNFVRKCNTSLRKSFQLQMYLYSKQDTKQCSCGSVVRALR